MNDTYLLNCLQCNEPIPNPRPGKRFCKDYHRVRWHREHKSDETYQKVEQRGAEKRITDLGGPDVEAGKRFHEGVEQQRIIHDLKHKCMNEHLDIEEVLEVMKYWFARLGETAAWTVPDWINALFVKTGKKIVVASTNSEGFPTDFAIEATK